MKQRREGSYPGTFQFASGTEVPGQLTFAGRHISFLAWSDKFSIYHSDFRFITGELYDAWKVSLIDCQDQQIDENMLSFGGMYNVGIDENGAPIKTNYTVELNPSYVLFGTHHLSPHEAVVHKMHFALEDAGALFYDEHVIGHVVGATANSNIKEIVKEIMLSRRQFREDDITTKVQAAGVFFGMVRTKPFINTTTILGQICAWHKLEPEGDINYRTLRNEVLITLEFDESLIFDEAMRRTRSVLEFFNLISGRPQNLKLLTLETSKDESGLDVYVFPEYERQTRLQARDALVDGVNRSDEFSRMLTNWLDKERNKLWRDVRTRLATYTCERNQFGVDHLVGLANIFDVLPSTEYPPVDRSDDVECAIKECKKVFKQLAPETMEPAMNALGRLHMPSLRDKVKYRAQVLTEKIGDKIPDIDIVIDEAVKYRNYLVHGSGTDVDPDVARFFADTLEFVFASSDLVESGWDIRYWCDTRLPSSHPFAAYLGSYTERLARMK